MRLPGTVRRFLTRHALLIWWPLYLGFSGTALAYLIKAILEMQP